MGAIIAENGRAETEARRAQTLKATLNILEDFQEEKARARESTQAVLNILADYEDEKDDQRLANRAMLNILADFEVEKNASLQMNRAVVNILEDLELERAKTISLNEGLEERVRGRTADLARSEERFRLLVDGVKDYAILMLDPQGTVLTWNAGAERMKGYRAEEIIGQPFSRFYPAEDQASGKPQLELRHALQHGSFEDEGTRIRKDGSSFMASVILTAVYDENDRHIGFAKVTRDITERKRAESLLRETETKLKLFITHAPAALAMFDRDMRYLGASRRWLSDYGLGDASIVGRLHCEIFPEIPDRWKAIHRRGLKGEIVQAEEERFERADGSVQWLRWEMRPWPAADGTTGGILLFTEDITKRKQSEEALRHSEELLRLAQQKVHAELEDRVVERTAQLEAANKELEAFSYSISHDLRAPLRAIDGFSRIVLKDFAPSMTPEAQEYLQDIRVNTQQMGHLVDDLLAFSRLSRQPLKKEPVAMAYLVGQCLEELRGEQKWRGVEIHLEVLPECSGDAALLKQVWTNLLANALKYSSKREGAIIEVGSYCDNATGERVYFVKDNGVGFDMDYAHKLFGVFQRLHRAEDYEGTGVGLAIVQRIVHRHGGRVWADAQLDKGASFFFTLASGGPVDD